MKDNDEIRNINSSKSDDAQAVNESELLPIYNAMCFSGDIQPLEEIKIPDYENNIIKKERSESKKNDLKKKSNPIKSVFNKVPKRLIVIVAVIIALAAIAAGTVWFTLGNEENKSPVRSVYAVGEDMQMLLCDGSTYSLSGAQEVKVSDSGMMLYFSQNTSSKTGKYELKAVDISKKRSIQKAGELIDSGVEPGWQVNAAGNLLCYCKAESGTKTLYVYSMETQESTAVASDVKEFFLPQKGDVIYFTRKTGDSYSLHRMKIGEEYQNVAGNITYVKFCPSAEDFEIIYTIPTGNEKNVNVFIVKNFDSPLEVCSDVSEVYANEYTYKGNLYYFTADKSKVNWQDFISDSYAESDITLKQPVQADYMVEKGFIFKRYVLDETAYNAALNKYKAKLQRDSIRTQLNNMDLGLTVEDEYSCHVYNGLTNKKLASGVKLDNIVAYSSKDAPRMVYRKSVIAVEDKISMDEIVKLSYESSIEDAVNHVMTSVKGSFSVADDCIYSWYDGAKVIEYSVKGYASDKTEFLLATSSSMYAVENGNLYINKVSKSNISNKELIDSYVSDFTAVNEYIYYTRAENPEKPALYRYSLEGGKEHICDNVHSYFANESGFVLSLTKQDGTSELVNIGVLAGGQFSEADTDVWIKNFIANGTTFAYLKNIGTSDVANSGEMYAYNPDEGVVKLADDVTKILFIR